jgi:hypothetical protein
MLFSNQIEPLEVSAKDYNYWKVTHVSEEMLYLCYVYVL